MTLPLVRYHADGPLDVIVLVVAIVLASIAVLIAVPERWVGRGGDDVPNMNGPTKFLQLAGVGTLVVAIVLGLTLTTEKAPVPSHLPGLRALILAVFAFQVMLVPLLFAGVGAQHPKRLVRTVAMTLGVLTVVTTVACVVWYVGRLSEDRGSSLAHHPRSSSSCSSWSGPPSSHFRSRRAGTRPRAPPPADWVGPSWRRWPGCSRWRSASGSACRPRSGSDMQ